MNERLDIRGLSCPQPVFLTKQKMEKLGKGTLEVLVDKGTALTNLKRLCTDNNWTLEETMEDNTILVKISFSEEHE